ncbi:MAG: nitronate monooxygenase [Coriobacteriales bacterium]|jgi:enoyl-[acyl-carrier protein] reductase II
MGFKSLANLLDIKYPFIQGGMANISNGAFAAAVSEAGAMGVIASGGFDVDGLREQISVARSITDKPFGINLMLKHPQVDEVAELIAAERIPFITTGAGNPAKYVEMWKDAGSLVFPVVPSTALAQRMVKSGVDGVIAEGTESGGHVGEMTTMALVPQVVAGLGPDVPVVAAGGIASGAQFIAALALGACGAQVGTCLLVSEECPIHDNYKQAIIEASDTDTLVTGRFAGSPVRQLKNHMSRAYLKEEKTGATREDLGHFMIGALRRAVYEGDTRDGSLIAGQVAGQLKEVRPLAAIFEDLYGQARAAIAQLDERAGIVLG